MSTESNSTTLPRRVLGRRLRQLRDKTKMSRTRAAHECEMGSQTLWRLESGRSSEVRKMVINALCDLYGASREERRILIWLAKECRKDGWWQSYAGAIVPEVEMFVGLEQSSSRIIGWQGTTLQGLLQTAGYRHAMWQISTALGKPVELERDIDLIAKRQERLLDTDNFKLEALISESVLRHRIGGAEVMKEQLNRLLELSRRPNVSIRVVRFDAPLHLGLMSKDFVFMEFPEHQNPALSEPPVVYVEGFTGALYLDKDSEIEQYRMACADIQRVALSEDDTRSLIEAILKEYDA
ncbi:helix-turn-helix domain-containing protein [Nocardia terpenica]|uniref:XRE family transcriptional regulator n=1 Tax=Nocardia terpenica TaxID=455432 RepID=A0A291RS40_9NOCA|nr:helix-turn-helix transcriptional regulator [Nocardia terpenica]ATL70441.1 XRE family transcriptional regulator [Nocardia terpenica]